MKFFSFFVILALQSIANAALDCAGNVESENVTNKVQLVEDTPLMLFAKSGLYQFMVLPGPQNLMMAIERHENGVLAFSVAAAGAVPQKGGNIALTGTDPVLKTQVSLICSSK